MVGEANFVADPALSRPFGACPLVHNTLVKSVASYAQSTPSLAMSHKMPLAVPFAESDAAAVLPNVCALCDVGDMESEPLSRDGHRWPEQGVLA